MDPPIALFDLHPLRGPICQCGSLFFCSTFGRFFRLGRTAHSNDGSSSDY